MNLKMGLNLKFFIVSGLAVRSKTTKELELLSSGWYLNPRP
jgi:hypothetical protein